MKKTKTLTTVLAGLAIALGLTFAACKKGDTGPAGPAGTNGANGNANVVSSTVTATSWAYTAPSWKVSFTYAAITQAVIDKGVVLVYAKVGNAYNQLPLTFYPASTYSSTWEVSSYLGGIDVIATDSDLTQPANPGSWTFKIVVMTASARLAHPNVDLKNYNEVKQAFNLVD
jgi:hypothetical protein